MEAHHGIVLLHLNELHLLQLLDAALHLGGLGGLVAEAVDKLLGLGNLPLLRLGLVKESLLARGAFLQVEGEVAGVLFCPAVVEGDGAGDQSVQQRHIMADDADGTAVGAQALLQPALALNIQVVGGFVQQQHLRLLQQELGKGDTHLPAAGELPAITREIRIREPQAAQDALCARAQRGRVPVLQNELQAADFLQEVAVFGGIGGELLHVSRELVHLLLELDDIAHGAQHLIQQRAPGDVDTLLRQIAHTGVLGQQNAPVVWLQGPHNTLHEGGFARTVLPGEGNTLPALHHKGELVEQDARPEFDMQVLDGEFHAAGSLLLQLGVPAVDVLPLLLEKVGAVVVNLDTHDSVALADTVDHLLVLGGKDLAEDGVLAVEPIRGHVGNEELGAVGALPRPGAAGIGHSQQARLGELQVRAALVVKLVAGAAAARSLGIAALNHEIRNHAVEGESIVEPLGCQVQEAGRRHRRLGGEHRQVDVPLVCLHRDFLVRCHAPHHTSKRLRAQGISAPAPSILPTNTKCTEIHILLVNLAFCSIIRQDYKEA